MGLSQNTNKIMKEQQKLEELQEAQKTVNELYSKFQKIDVLWTDTEKNLDEILCLDYPFKQCFGELTPRVKKWKSSLEIEVANLQTEIKFKKAWRDKSEKISLASFRRRGSNYDLPVEDESNVESVYVYPDKTMICQLRNGTFKAIVDRTEYHFSDISLLEDKLWEYTSRDNTMPRGTVEILKLIHTVGITPYELSFLVFAGMFEILTELHSEGKSIGYILDKIMHSEYSIAEVNNDSDKLMELFGLL